MGDERIVVGCKGGQGGMGMIIRLGAAAHFRDFVS